MRLLETLCFSFLVVSLTEVQQAQANCDITSITSPSASNLNIKWTSFPGATNYFMDLRVVNSSSVTPVVLEFTASTTEKLVQGLRPGSLYQVTLKVYQFYYVMCISSRIALTVPAVSQITYSRAISSTAVGFQWSGVAGADSYVLVVEGTFHAEYHNLTFSSLSGEMTGLQPAKSYSCYVYSSNAAGLGAKSSVKTVNTLVPPPGVVNVTTISNNAARATWSSVSGVVLYQVSLTENNRSGIAPLAWNTSATALNLANLKPCSSYTIGVSCMNMFLQPGEPSTVIYTTNPIASVTSISADYSCSNAMATLSWDSVPGARSYRAVATARNGTSLSCTSNGTSCQIAALGCGELYTVHITSIADCESISNISYTFETAPCPPQNPEVFHECLSNAIILTWAPTNHTAYYIAKSVDVEGVEIECLTLYTSCYFTQTECGRSYNFTVSSVYSGTESCSSGTTTPVTVKTAPCIPQNVRTSSMDCLSDTLITRWDPAPGALNYVVQARGNRDDFYNCTSDGTSCAMTNVKCGQSLSVWITASNDECTTDMLLAEVAETVPCAPQEISLTDTCGSFSITLSWLTSNNAIFYTAKAILPDSSVRSCYTMDTQCEITGLQCGQTYEAFVMSTNFICNSTDSQHITVQTAPCAPVSVQAEMHCQLNTATVQWQGQQAGGSYTALLADGEGAVLNCSTSSNNCSVPNLRCGHTYNVTVMQNDTQCNSLPSTAIQMESVPCAPQQVVGVVNCSSGAMSVGWNSSVVGVNYTAMVWSGAGNRVYCNSTEAHCSVGQLDCGKAYNVEVLAARGTCQSPPSQQVTVEQVPCVPTNVSVSRACGMSSVSITWAPSAGAQTYIAVAIDTYGQRSQCVSIGTSCSIANLTCGQVYSVGVMATNDNCSSQLSQTVALYTDPCAPTSVSGLVNCSSSTASLLWAPSPNTLRYIGRLESSGDVRTCNVSTAGCQITGLLCGQHYNFTVSATDGSCSTQTVPIQLDTAPCATQNVSTTLACDTNSLTVSWSPAAMSQNYIAIAVWKGSTALSCSSQNTSCSMHGLQCGQQYNVTVTASNGNCSGPASPVQTIQTAPCVPQNVTGHVTCGSGSLVASWAAAPGASSYRAIASASGRDPQVCVTANLSCVFSGLQCASLYSISVASQSEICNSTSSLVTTISTGPCDPQNVTAVLQCSSSLATVMWNASKGAITYTVLAQTDGGQTLAASCSTSSTSCQLTSLTCGKTFNITVLAGDATCNTTSQPSAAVATAPCLPIILNTSLDCATNAALISWTPVNNAIRYLLNGISTNGHEVSCVSTNSSCSLTELECGQTYSVFATARGQQCDSSPSTSVNVITVPCPPSMVNTYYDCKNNTALISWSGNDGSVSFAALLQGDGFSESCSSTGLNCSVTNLRCGHAYNVTVKVLSNLCNSSYSQPTGIQTVPCATQNVSALWQCANNSAVVAWAPSTGVSWYGVTALGSDGDIKQCNSTTSTCQLSQMHCGQIYDITVTPHTNSCTGVRSTAITFNAGPCAPTNLTMGMQCQGNVGVASWVAAIGADSYTATATAGDGHTHTCTSNSTSCSFTDLHCGETYSVTVVTVKLGCLSDPSSAVAIRTAPCTPANVSATLDCSRNIGNISWTSAAGAIVYNTRLTAGNGHYSTCSTSGTSCVLTLDCGQSYSAVVVASTGVCNSSESSSLQFRSAPCLPQNVTAALDCAANQLAVQWQGTSGSDLYTAVATSSSGQQASCNISSASSCSIQGLHCGQIYNITVASSSSNCSTIKASGSPVQSAPCKPQNISVDLQCSSNSATVQWGSCDNAQSYSVTALDMLGGNITCSSINTSCVLNGLSCGRTYNVTVVSRNYQCVSEVSNTVELITAPCSPTHVTASFNCTSNSASISWDTALGVTSYLVQAVGSAGYNTSCSSTNPPCSIRDLQCGQNYSFRVTAQHNSCFSPVSQDITLSAAPCPSTNLQASLDCSSSSVLVSWSLGNGTQLSNVTVQSLQTPQQFSCISNGSSCNISTLPCGQRYALAVTGYRQSCSTRSDVSLTLDTAPCGPTELNVTSTCNSNTTSVAWTPSSGTVAYYIASAEPSSGLTLTCNTSSTSCDISGLTCGQTYNVSVTAYRGGCAGGRSLTHSHKTAPCTPQSVQFQLLTCQSGNLSIAWQPSKGALSYRAEAVTLPGQLLSCDSTSTSCLIPGLSCGQPYDVSVVAVGENCNSSHSVSRQAQGAPCPPSFVTAVVNCTTNTASVSWNSLGVVGAMYTVSAITNTAPPIGVECNSTGSSCTLTDLQCGTLYNVTVTATKDNCTSLPSAVYSFLTASCVPTLNDITLDCGSGSALASWSGAGLSGADLYSVSAVDNQGGQLSCNDTQTLSCTVWGLRCGRMYTFSVRAARGQCTSTASNTLQTHTAACPAQEIQTTIGCRNSTASVSWAPANGAVSYSAMLQSSDGLTYSCNSSATSCDVTNLPCGQTYSVTVATKGHNCISTNSTGSPVKSAPCVPQNLSASVNCSRNIATVSWQSSQGALRYFVMANSSSGQSANCTSVNTFCDLTTLACGLTYTVTVMAKDSNCSSACSAPVQLQTVPCVPQNVVSVVDCETNNVTVSWSPSMGAHLYTVTLQDSNGLSGTCLSTGGQCNATGLRCGQLYHVSVTASDYQCTSAPSTSTDVHSVPCAPSSISAELNCMTDVAVVAWGPSAGSQGYSVSAVASQGRFASCSSNSSSNSCMLSSLKCGAAYTVSVKALGATCNSSTGMSGLLTTEPCIPQNLSVQYDLYIAMLFWDVTQGATSFTVLAETPQGLNATCPESSDTYCALSDMQCGQIYIVTVTAHNGACNRTGIATSDPYQLMTEPCPPQNVRARANCSTHVASISWDASLVAVGYVVFLDGRNGDSRTYATSQTSYSIPGLSCGMVYTTYVQALGQVYNSSNSDSVNLLTAPCSPDSTSVSVQMDCTTDTALLSWAYSTGVDNYTAVVLGSGGYFNSCSTQENHCNISLQCGQTYNLTLTSINQQCQISTVTNTTFQSSPCVPTGLTVVQASGCGSAGAILNWNFTAGADEYVVNGWNRDGHTLSLNTNLSTISLPNLHCSQEYNFSVTASNQQCNSTPSLPARLHTGPCSAATVTAVLDCSSSVAVVSWQPSNSTALYTATLQDSSEPPLSCVGVGSQCNISGLACGKNYSVSVTVSNDQCNSTTALPSGLQTGPCVPVNVSVVSECANNSAVVVWDHSSGATSYHVSGKGNNGNVSCQSTTPTCVLTNLICGSTYSVQVVAEGNSCSSVPSVPVALSSAPCQPTNLSVDMQCANATAVLSWAAQTEAVQYFATAQSDSAQSLHCQTANTSCVLQGLQCGSVYNFSVLASNGVCNSSYSKTLTGGGAPCPPASFWVVPSVLMGQGQLLRAYWSTVNCPGSRYLLEVSGSIQGEPQSLFQMTSYWTNRTYFETPIPCSSTYNANVRAQNSGGTSAPSAVVTGISVPCPPLSVTFTGSNFSAVVAWNASLYATMYHVYQVTSNGRTQLCNTTQLSCPVTNVNSNLVVVTAGNKAGESAGTSDVHVIATRVRRDLRPTKMDELSSPQAQFTMVTADSLWLEWTRVEGAEFYSLLIREQSSSAEPVYMTVYGEASIISDLKPATTYCVSLSATTPSSSRGPYSESVCVRTADLS